MQIQLDSEFIQKLSSKGVLAYVAVTLADGTTASTASLAGLVGCQSAVMLEGLKEVSLAAPEMIGKEKTKWRCGVVKAGAGQVVQNLDIDNRRAEFIDDIKKIFEWANKGMAFTMDGTDGRHIQKFLRQYRDWDRPMWQQALRNRFLSEGITKSAPVHRWIGILVEYANKPLDRYGKEMEHGGGERGKAVGVREANRQAVERAVANA